MCSAPASPISSLSIRLMKYRPRSTLSMRPMWRAPSAPTKQALTSSTCSTSASMSASASRRMPSLPSGFFRRLSTRIAGPSVSARAMPRMPFASMRFCLRHNLRSERFSVSATPTSLHMGPVMSLPVRSRSSMLLFFRSMLASAVVDRGVIGASVTCSTWMRRERAISVHSASYPSSPIREARISNCVSDGESTSAGASRRIIPASKSLLASRTRASMRVRRSSAHSVPSASSSNLMKRSSTVSSSSRTFCRKSLRAPVGSASTALHAALYSSSLTVTLTPPTGSMLRVRRLRVDGADGSTTLGSSGVPGGRLRSAAPPPPLLLSLVLPPSSAAAAALSSAVRSLAAAPFPLAASAPGSGVPLALLGPAGSTGPAAGAGESEAPVPVLAAPLTDSTAFASPTDAVDPPPSPGAGEPSAAGATPLGDEPSPASAMAPHTHCGARRRPPIAPPAVATRLPASAPALRSLT
mmetsp:Transcript_23730/g.82523  ORF Transcript_23730/g.82523 Transcript_23730/m.82523 type:complete len:468 (-) Transcript_23730:333-1736(-)